MLSANSMVKGRMWFICVKITMLASAFTALGTTKPNCITKTIYTTSLYSVHVTGLAHKI